MSAAANNARVRRYAEYALGQGDLCVIDALITPDQSVHAYPSDHSTGGAMQAARAFVTTMCTAMPDLPMTVELQIAEGDPLMPRWPARHASRGDDGGAGDDQAGGDDRDQQAPLVG